MVSWAGLAEDTAQKLPSDFTERHDVLAVVLGTRKHPI
jgi:hypothetical protein